MRSASGLSMGCGSWVEAFRDAGLDLASGGRSSPPKRSLLMRSTLAKFERQIMPDLSGAGIG